MYQVSWKSEGVVIFVLIWHGMTLVSFVFGEVLFGGSASLHDLFLHFLVKCFFCNLFRGMVLGGGNKCVGVNVCGAGMVLEWNVFEDDSRSIGFDFYPSQHQEGLRLHVHGEKSLFVRVSYVTGM